MLDRGAGEPTEPTFWPWGSLFSSDKNIREGQWAEIALERGMGAGGWWVPLWGSVPAIWGHFSPLRTLLNKWVMSVPLLKDPPKCSTSVQEGHSWCCKGIGTGLSSATPWYPSPLHLLGKCSLAKNPILGPPCPSTSNCREGRG